MRLPKRPCEFAASIFAFILLCSSMAHAQTTAASDAPPAIDWRVADRFRLFSEAGTEAISRVEGLMGRIANEPPGAALLRLHDDFLDSLSGASAESLRRSTYEPAPNRARHGSGRYRRDYLYPESYEILVHSQDPRLASSNCRWSTPFPNLVDVGNESRPCHNPMRLNAGPGRRVNGEWIIATALRLSVDGGPEYIYEIRFRDTLVVALGDSYISGEGNPDVPSVITSEPLPVFERASWGAKLSEAHRDYQRAVWWDEPCHRSLLSWPVLSSLAYAAKRPREAVTLVHLGCSGAVVADITIQGEIELPGGGNEPRGESQLAQLDQLLNVESATGLRVPNRILLSVGGNDSGFVGVIKTIVLPPEGYFVPLLGPILVGLRGEAICPYRDSGRPLARLCSAQLSAQQRLEDSLPGALDRLVTHLDRPGWGPVSHFTYPNPIVGEDGRVCDVVAPRDPEHVDSMSGFEAIMGYLPWYVRGFQYSWDFNLNYAPELGSLVGGELFPGSGCDWRAEPTDSEVCQGLWVHANLTRLIAVMAVAAARRWQSSLARRGHLRHGLCRSARLPAGPAPGHARARLVDGGPRAPTTI